MIWNLTKKTVLSAHPCFAQCFFMRLRGMILRHFRKDCFDGMIFPRCSAVHTFFMSFPLDLVFVDGENRVVKTAAGIRPWCPVIAAAGAATVLELPEGAIRESGTEAGDVLDLNGVPDDLTEKTIRNVIDDRKTAAAFASADASEK